MILALRNLTIRSRLTLLLTVLLVCMAGLSWYLTGVVRSTKDQVRQVYKEGALTVRYALETSAHMSAAEVALYRGMNADDPNKIAEYSATAFDESSKIGETNKQFAKLLEGTPEGRKLLSRCNQAFSAWEPLVSEVADLIQGGANVSMILDGLNNMVAQSKVFKAVMDEAVTQTTKDMEAQEKALDARLAAASTTALVVTLAAAALALLVGMAIANSIAGPVKRTMTALDEAAESLDLTRRADESGRDELSAMSRSLNRLMERCQEALVSVSTLQGQVTEHAENFSAIAQQTSASVQEVRAGVGEAATQMDNLAAGTEQINASVEEVAAGAQSTAERSTEVASQVARAQGAAEEGIAAVRQVVRQVLEVARTTRESEKSVQELADRAQQIRSFVGSIGQIADQTNLLALNAAIEAARAGEAGRGFAVVAEEVRKLAEASNEAAQNIADLAQQIEADLDSETRGGDLRRGPGAGGADPEGHRPDPGGPGGDHPRLPGHGGGVGGAGRVLRGDRRGGAEHVRPHPEGRPVRGDHRAAHGRGGPDQRTGGPPVRRPVGAGGGAAPPGGAVRPPGRRSPRPPGPQGLDTPRTEPAPSPPPAPRVGGGSLSPGLRLGYSQGTIRGGVPWSPAPPVPPKRTEPVSACDWPWRGCSTCWGCWAT